MFHGLTTFQTTVLVFVRGGTCGVVPGPVALLHSLHVLLGFFVPEPLRNNHRAIRVALLDEDGVPAAEPVAHHHDQPVADPALCHPNPQPLPVPLMCRGLPLSSDIPESFVCPHRIAENSFFADKLFWFLFPCHLGGNKLNISGCKRKFLWYLHVSAPESLVHQ